MHLSVNGLRSALVVLETSRWCNLAAENLRTCARRFCSQSDCPLASRGSKMMGAKYGGRADASTGPLPQDLPLLCTDGDTTGADAAPARKMLQFSAEFRPITPPCPLVLFLAPGPTQGPASFPNLLSIDSTAPLSHTKCPTKNPATPLKFQDQ
jgi:hypothetical protein